MAGHMTKDDVFMESIDRYLEMARDRLASYRSNTDNTVLLDMAIECAMSAVHGMYDIRLPLADQTNADHDE